jgi:hypothetical protein
LASKNYFFEKKQENNEFLAQLNKVNLRKKEINEKKYGPAFSETHDKFRDLILQYQEKNYKVPDLSIKNNIFKQSPLLMTNHEIYKYKVPKDLRLRKNKGFMSKLRNLTEIQSGEIIDAIDENEEIIEIAEPIKQEERTQDNVEGIKRLIVSIGKCKKDIKLTRTTIESMNNKVFRHANCYNSAVKNRKMSLVHKDTLIGHSRNTNQDSTLYSLIDSMMSTGRTVNSQVINSQSERKSSLKKTLPAVTRRPIKLINRTEYLKMFNSPGKGLNALQKPVEQIQQLEELYSSVDIDNFEINKDGIVNYFSTFYGYDKKKFNDKENVTPAEVLKTIHKFQKKVGMFDLQEIKKNSHHYDYKMRNSLEKLE